MDYYVRLVGLLIMVIGGTSPDVTVNTAFAPRWQNGLKFCTNTITVPEHAVFIRVTDSRVIKDQTNWPGQKACADPNEHCMLFPITTPSEIVIDAGFTPTATSKPGTTFSLLPRLGTGVPALTLVPNPQNVAAATLKMPGGTMEALTLGNGTAVTWVRVLPPAGTPVKDITIQAIPNGGGTPPKLVVKVGTLINIVNLPPHHAGLNLDMANPQPDPNHLHYFLVNALLPAQFEKCSPPTPSPDLDPLCSNQGCCP